MNTDICLKIIYCVLDVLITLYTVLSIDAFVYSMKHMYESKKAKTLATIFEIISFIVCAFTVFLITAGIICKKL